MSIAVGKKRFRLSDGILVAFAIASFLSAMYIGGKVVTDQASAGGNLAILGFIAVGSLSLFVAWRFGPEVTTVISIVIVSTVVALYAADIFVVLNPNRPLLRNLVSGFDSSFDLRSKKQFVKDARKAGNEMIVPTAIPGHLISVQDGFRVAGGVIQPLAGISNSPTVLCNEVGEWLVYKSDRYGFRNPDQVWDGSIDIALVGDSFTLGSCVKGGQDLGSLLRTRFRRTLNLGYSGNGPLIELATIREYLPRYRPRVVVLFFFEGNDLDDLRLNFAKSSILRKYLEIPGFRQGLPTIQESIDGILNRFITQELKSSDALNFDAKRARNILLLRNLREAFGLQVGKDIAIIHAENVFVLLERVLIDVKKEVKSWNGKLVFVFLPSISHFLPDAATSTVREQVLSRLSALGIPIVDITRTFERNSDPASLWVMRTGNNHFTPLGYRIVSEEVLKTLDPLLSN